MTDEQAYTVLRVEPGAAPKEVQKAYRARALEYHPDRASSEEEAAYLTRKFMEVRDAYEHLRNAGFPMPEPEVVFEDIPPGSWSAGRSFSTAEPEEVGTAEKLGLGVQIDLGSIGLWVVIALGGAVVFYLFKTVFDKLSSL